MSKPNVNVRKDAITILDTLRAIEDGFIRFEDYPDEMKNVLGKRFAEDILNALPEKVGTFYHTETECITHTRYDGDTWDEKQANNWANKIYPEYTSEISRGRLH